MKKVYDGKDWATFTIQLLYFNWPACKDQKKKILATNLNTYSEAMDNISGWISSSAPRSHLNVNKKYYMDFSVLWEDINKI